MEESNNQFIEEDISEYMSSEELEKILTYICKKFDVIEDSKIQLKNCMNLIEFIKNKIWLLEKLKQKDYWIKVII